MKLSEERILRSLKGLGISNKDAQVYIFLAKNGPHNEKEITETLEIIESQVYRSLKNLQSIEIVKAVGEHPLLYSAVPFEEMIDLFIEVKKEQAKTMQESREGLLSIWKTALKKNSAK